MLEELTKLLNFKLHFRLKKTVLFFAVYLKKQQHKFPMSVTKLLGSFQSYGIARRLVFWK